MIRFKEQPGLVLYLTCGDPSLQSTIEIALAAIEAGADVIELGVPFSDPVADGPVIQRASERALKHNTSLADVLTIAREIRKRSDAGLIVFSYLNPLMRYGLQRFCTDAAGAGIDGALVTDMPIEEAAEYKRMMQACDLDTVFLAAPTSTDARLRSIAAVSTGFVYAVSRTGVTGAQRELAEDVESLVKRIRRFTKLPVALGFGVSTSEQFAAIGHFADAAVVGSAVMELIERNPKNAASVVADFVRKLVGSRKLQTSGVAQV
jgi:tryptophan synthase alpha chain